MSATVETNNVSWRKRKREEELLDLQLDMKKPRYYYYRLASESSKNSEDDTETVYSYQDRDTEEARDTSDTSVSDPDSDADQYEVIEYEVASLSESEKDIFRNNTSDSDDQVIFAVAIGAMCDSSETWITDCEESDNSSLDDSVVTRLGFSTCVQCKSENDNPLYRYCEKCFQTCKKCKKHKTYKCFLSCTTCYKDRKKFYPPRPRGTKKARRKLNNNAVKLDNLRSCLNGMSSQDSGIGSSQECPSLDLDQIVVPDKHLKPGTSGVSSKADKINKEKVSKDIERQLRRKRQASESSLSDFDIKKTKYSHTIPTPRKDLSANKIRSSSRNSQGKQIVSDQPLDLSQPPTDEKSISLSQSSTSTESSVSLSKPCSEKSLTLRSSTQSSSQTKTLPLSQSSDNTSQVGSSTSLSSSSTNLESTELCIMCNSAPKDSIFLHTYIGHQCCCYNCAKRTLHTTKRCPICNRPVNKVVKIFQS